MKIVVIFLALITITLLSSSSARSDLPACIQKKIDSDLSGHDSSLPVRISKYLYRGKTTYLWINGCCDQFNDLYDEACNLICAPSGGFIGNGDGRCTDFSQTATPLGNVWTNPQSRN